MKRTPDDDRRFPMSHLGDTAPLDDVRAELDAIEAQARAIRDLTGLLQAGLTPEQFRLVWALRDAVEALGIAEALLRERRMVEALARHLPAASPALRALSRHLRRDPCDLGDPS